MRLLYSTVLGMEIIDEAEHQIHGTVSDLLIDPDRGKILALHASSPFSPPSLVQTQDILSFGQRVHVRDAEVIGSAGEIIRLQPFLEGKRTIIHQAICTKRGMTLGKCIDLQFHPETFDIEWIFPRKFLRRGPAIPASDILEVTEDAIIVKDQGPRPEEAPVVETVPTPEVDPLISPIAGRSASYSPSSRA
jgi:uncharacterized protein YrrD